MDKRYLSVKEAASRLNLEVLDLLIYGVEGEIPIGLLPYSEISIVTRPNASIAFEDESQSLGGTPDWIIMLIPSSIRAIAQGGKVESGQGYRWHDNEWEFVGFGRESGITLDDLIVPIGALPKLEAGNKQHTMQQETTVSIEGKETFQKQIAGLAIVIHRQATGIKFGEKAPNKAQIAMAVMATIDELPADVHKTLSLKGIGDSAIRQNIAKGLKLLGFPTKEDGEK
jgi:hypothetical protein